MEEGVDGIKCNIIRRYIIGIWHPFTRLNKRSIIILDLGGGHYRTDATPIIHSPLLAKKKETTTLSRSRIEGYAGAF